MTATRRQFIVTAALPIAAAAVAFSPVARATMLLPPINLHPDAELLALGRQREDLIATFYAPGGVPDEVADRIGAEWLALDYRIMALTPKTGAGLAVQLDVVWWDMGMTPGEEKGPCAESHRSRVWYWQIKQAAAALAA